MNEKPVLTIGILQIRTAPVEKLLKKNSFAIFYENFDLQELNIIYKCLKNNRRTDNINIHLGILPFININIIIDVLRYTSRISKIKEVDDKLINIICKNQHLLKWDSNHEQGSSE